MVMRVIEIGGREHCNNPGRALGSRDVDPHDLGEGMRRAHEIGSERIVRFDVVAEAAAAAQQGVIFHTPLPGVLVVSSGGRLRHAMLQKNSKLAVGDAGLGIKRIDMRFHLGVGRVVFGSRGPAGFRARVDRHLLVLL